MAFLDKAGLQTVTNKLVQGDAIKVASIRGRTVENVIDNITRECTNVPTPLEYKIENRVTDFKVGQGRDVNAYEDVEAGYTEVELQGKTWQNLGSIQYCNLPSHSNVVDANIITIPIQNHRYNSFSISRTMFKPSTTYTLFVNMIQNNGSPSVLEGEIEQNIGFALQAYSYSNSIVMDSSDAGAFGCFYKHRETGFKSCTFKTHDLELFNERRNGIVFELQTFYSATGGEQKFQMLILEGDHTQTPIEELPNYFEGIQSSFEDGVVAVRSGEQEYTASIGEPLRSLPSGTCDEIKTGNLIRRVGKVVLDGSEEWSKENSKRFYTPIKLKSPGWNCGLSDKYFVVSQLSTATQFDKYIALNGHNNANVCQIRDVEIENKTIDEFKQWLQENPTTVLYELAEPIITPIDPIKFETQPLGSIEINSEISPTSFHTVQLNRAAQIERGITEIAELKNRVEILETIYDSHFLETAHKLELLGMDYELESEEF